MRRCANLKTPTRKNRRTHKPSRSAKEGHSGDAGGVSEREGPRQRKRTPSCQTELRHKRTRRKRAGFRTFRISILFQKEKVQDFELSGPFFFVFEPNWDVWYKISNFPNPLAPQHSRASYGKFEILHLSSREVKKRRMNAAVSGKQVLHDASHLGGHRHCQAALRPTMRAKYLNVTLATTR